MAVKARLAQRPSKDYIAEFRELGVDAVRQELLQRRWPPEKLSAARVWVESRDTHSWVASRSDKPPVDRRKNRPLWVAILIGGALFAFAGVRLFERLF